MPSALCVMGLNSLPGSEICYCIHTVTSSHFSLPVVGVKVASVYKHYLSASVPVLDNRTGHN